MNRIILSLFASVLILISCADATKIDVTKDDMVIGIKGQCDTIIVNADGGFNVDAPDWVSIEKKENILICTTPQNDSGAKREGEIILSGSGDVKKIIKISQADKCSILSVSDSTATFTREGGDVKIDILTDGAAIKVASENGINAKCVNDNQLVISMPVNTATTAISGKVTLSCDEQTAVINVSQQGSVCSTCKGAGRIRCPKCNGTYHTNKTCRECGGEGFGYCCKYTGKEYCDANHDFKGGMAEIICPECHGMNL